MSDVSKATPGPWHATTGNLVRVITDTGEVVCGVHKIGRFTGEHDPEVTRANALLLAAAQDLLAALTLAADCIKDFDGGDPSTETGWKSGELLDVWLKSRAAIAKATGGKT